MGRMIDHSSAKSILLRGRVGNRSRDSEIAPTVALFNLDVCVGNAMVNWSEFSVEVKGRPLTCLLAEPKKLSDHPALLLNFAADRTATLKSEPYNITPRMFLAAGHRAASFNLPCHGDREVPGQPRGIAGFCAEWRRGVDVFAGFVDEGRAVWLAIGNSDARVGTDACLRFAEAVVRAEAEKGISSSRFVLHVVPEREHELSGDWRQCGGKYLLDWANKQPQR